MTTARASQINLGATPFYHIITRCARQSYLCGFDKLTHKDYSHRKAWIVDKIKYLSSIFSIKTCAYGIMSNHYHLVLAVDEKSALNWSDDEVYDRWEKLFPQNAKQNQNNPLKIPQWRKKLMDISQYMKCLNEPIARLANKEDELVGTSFWGGRFKSQALLDEGALLSAMVYVDLNPIRAGICNTPEDSEFTSIFERIQYIHQQQNKIKKGKKKKTKVKKIKVDDLKQPQGLVPFADIQDNSDCFVLNFKLSDYLELVDYTGRVIREDKRGAIPSHLAPILSRLNFDTKGWLSIVRNLGGYFYHAIGSPHELTQFGERIKRRLKGQTAAKLVYLGD